MMKVVVTGASGFIGKHLLNELSKHDIEIVAVVRDVTQLVGISDSIKIIEMDIARPTSTCIDLMEQPDVLIHLAWGGLTNYKSLNHINVELPIHFSFIRLMVDSGVKDIVVAGTCFEYGMQSGELHEELDARPNNPYGYAKDALRKQLQFLQQVSDFNLTWLRPFYIYGEDQPDNTLYSQLRLAAQRGETTFNMSGGEQLRDYLCIDEVTKKIIELSINGRNLGIVNVCSGIPISVRRLVEQWKERNGWDIELNLGYYPYPDYEPLAFWGSSDKYNRLVK